MLARPGTAHSPSGNWELDHEPLSDLEVVRQHHRQHPRLLCPAVTEHVLWACRVLGTRGTDTAPPAGQRVGRHVDSTGESQGSAGGRWAALGHTAALTLLRHNERLRHKPCGPPRTTPSRQAPEVLGERGWEGTRWHLPELRMHVCAKAGRVHFQISTDRRHTPSHLSTTLPTRERSRQASGHRAGGKMVAPPPCWGAQTTQSPLLQPWGPQDPGEALGDEQAKGHVAVDAPAQARLEVTRLPARKPSLTLKGRPAWLQCSRTKAPHAPTPR